jgi:Lanthionine synthetase C-like protein
MLFDPDSHEPLVDAAWDSDAVARCVASICADAESALRPGWWWPWHPLDLVEDDPDVVHGVYLGAAGVVWALDRLARLGLHSAGRDYGRLAVDVLDGYRSRPEFDDPQRSLWMGELGVALVAWLLAPDSAVRDRLGSLVRLRPDEDTLELMWGSPGQLVAADVMGEGDAAGAIVDHLLAIRGDDGFWTQQLYGSARKMVGPAHGFTGVVAALGDRVTPHSVTAAIASAAVRSGSFANWPARVGEPLADNDNPVRTQWCHGAPGVVTSLAGLPHDEELDALLLAGGSLTWAAGPLVKGAGLCHGTAGNGFAFLKLFTRTGDELWLARARSFAMHAVAQVEAARRSYGRGRYTLWTGDLGTAWYLAQCLAGESAVPTIDAW